MKKPLLLTFLTSVIFLLFLANASAALVSLSKTTFNLQKSITSDNLAITANDDITLVVSYTPDIIYDDNGNTMTFTSDTLNEVVTTADPTRIINLSYIATNFEFELKRYELGNLTIYAQNQSDASINETHILKVQMTSGFCVEGSIGNLDINSVEDTTSDWDWEPLDDINIEVGVENDHDEKKSVRVRIALYDSAGKKIDLGDEDDLIQRVSLEEDESEDVEFDIQVPGDIDSGNYKLYIKAYLSDEEESCIDNWGSNSFYKSVTIEKESREVVMEDKNLMNEMPLEVLCNQEVSLDLPIYNIGENDEEKVKLTFKSNALGINAEKILSDLEENDMKKVSFNFITPENLTVNQTYSADLFIYFDYDEGYYDEYNSYGIDFIPIGNCKVRPEATLTANLITELDEVEAGEQVKINASVKNSGKEKATYTMSVEGLSGWAKLKSITPQILTLDPDEEKSVMITLQLDGDAEEEYIFTLNAESESEVIEQQQISLFVENTGFFSSIGGWLADHWGLLIVIIINVLLLVFVVILVLRFLSNSSASSGSTLY